MTSSPMILMRSSLISATLPHNLSLISFHVECERFTFRNRCLYLKKKKKTHKVIWGAPYTLKRT